MTRYRGVARAQQRARTHRVEAEARKRDEVAEAATLSNDEITAAVYRLQSRRSPRLAPRIRELVAEQQRRRQSEETR